MNPLRPFFSYYGGKWRAAPHYPEPSHKTIVEAFAGSAGYALRYPNHDVILCDADPIVAGLWRYLTRVTPGEIRDLPLIRSADQTVDDLGLACEEQRWLVGFWLNAGMTAPCNRPSKWMRTTSEMGGTGWTSGCGQNFWGEKLRERVASQVDHIRHWKVLDDYRQAPNEPATWFVDPPYSGAAGRRYRRNQIDYPALGAWCRSRNGQVLVCENQGADWLPFQPFRTIRGTPGSKRTGVSVEVLWTDLDEVLS